MVHRPSTIALADRAALLDGGRIVATGTHTELLRDEPRYRAILAQAVRRRGPVRAHDGRGPARPTHEVVRMTRATAKGLDVTGDEAIDSWRGVAAEDVDDVKGSLADCCCGRAADACWCRCWRPTSGRWPWPPRSSA